MNTTVMQTAKRLVRSRPLLSLTTASVVSATSYGYYVEKNTEQKYKEFLRKKGVKYAISELGNSTENQVCDDDVVLLPRGYDRDMIAKYWEGRPMKVLHRVASIIQQVVPIIWSYARDFYLLPPTDELQHQSLQTIHATNLRYALTILGPAFVKFGQQLSIRPDLLPPLVLKELQKLCDSVEPVSDEVAMEMLHEELGDALYEDVDMEKGIALVASASLGQVYQANLKSDNPGSRQKKVAIKVQRPDMMEKVSLDLFLLHNYGRFLDFAFDILTKQVPFHVDFIDCFATGSYNELDYEKEAANQMFFKDEFSKRKSKVHIPSVHSNLTSRRVITTDWVDGVKLASAPKNQIRDLIPVGVELFLTQLLDIGAFHADPHPGNLYVTKDGTLSLLDFGLCVDIDIQSRYAMTTAIVHLLNGDFDTLIASDAKHLGFLPMDLDTTELKPILAKILTEGLLESGSNLKARKKKLLDISNELNEVFFHYPFSVPPFFALITRGLGLLEGIALSGDPDFDIFQASYPYARRRAAEIYGTHSWKMLKRRLSS